MITEGPVVIKYGGSLLEEPGHRTAFLKDIAVLSKKQKVILVHGGGKEISRELEKRNIQPRFVDGRRVTDDTVMAIVDDVLQKVNGTIVKELMELGVTAKGFSGKTDKLMTVTALIKDLGRVADSTSTTTLIPYAALRKILDEPVLPVFYSVVLDQDGKPINMNADDFALRLAGACYARRLVFLTDSGGISGSDGKTIPQISPDEVDELIYRKVITGGMIVKAQNCVFAVREGVSRVDIVKGIDYLIHDEIKPEGTIFVKQI